MDAKFKHDFLYRRMTAAGHSLQSIAGELGMSEASLAKKLDGESDFTLSELMKIRKLFFFKKTLDEMIKMLAA